MSTFFEIFQQDIEDYIPLSLGVVNVRSIILGREETFLRNS